MSSGIGPLQLAAGALFLLVGPIGLWLGIGDQLPARVGCECEAADVGSDWAQYGTATSAPLAPLIALLVGFGLTFASGWRQAVGIGILIVTAAITLVASLGEPFVPGEADTPHFLIAIFRTLTYAAAVAVVVLGLRQAGSRRGARSGEAEA